MVALAVAPASGCYANWTIDRDDLVLLTGFRQGQPSRKVPTIEGPTVEWKGESLILHFEGDDSTPLVMYDVLSLDVDRQGIRVRPRGRQRMHYRIDQIRSAGMHVLDTGTTVGAVVGIAIMSAILIGGGFYAFLQLPVR